MCHNIFKSNNCNYTLPKYISAIPPANMLTWVFGVFNISLIPALLALLVPIHDIICLITGNIKTISAPKKDIYSIEIDLI